MKRFEITREIAARVDQVWALMVDVERWPTWTASMTRLERLDPGPLGPSSRVRISQPRLPPTVWTVTDFRNGHSFTWVSRKPGLATTARHVVEPTATGSRVALGLDLDGPLSATAAGLGGKLIREYLALEIEGLKRRCEAG